MFKWCILVLLCLIIYRIKIIYSFWKYRKIPYETPIFPFGNLGFLMRRSISDFFYDLKKKHEDYVGVFLGMKPALVVQTPQLARQILVKDYEYFQDRHLYCDSSDPIGSFNLFTLKNPLWRQMRNEISPMFTAARLRSITKLMNVNSEQLVGKIRRDYVEGGETVNLKELFTMYISDTVAFSVFGIRVSALEDKSSPLWCICLHMVKWTFWRGLEFIMIFFIPVVAAFFRLKLFSEAGSEYLRKLFWKIVNERKNNDQWDEQDLVNILLKVRENLKLTDDSNSELADNLMVAQAAVFVLASVETASAVLSYCLHELAYHPDEQEKLYAEIEEALKRSGKSVLEYDDLLELKYLTACLYETMRRHTPVPHLDRICAKTYKLNDQITIEQGTPVLVNVVAIHHDETCYPDPEEWRPDRFKITSDNDSLQCSFLPFGEGPRFCIGKRYALMQMRTALAQIVNQYKIEPAMPHLIKSDPYSIVLSPHNGGRVHFVPR